MHIGRSFDGGGHLEASCPCPLEPCGLVDTEKVVDECEQHPPARCRTMRTGHPADDCPGVRRDVVVAVGKTKAARDEVLEAAAMETLPGYFNASLLGALDDYRAAVEHEAAERIRNSDRLRDYTDDHMSDCNMAADEIDPEVTT
ncbi:hypothetical protein [Streptomyces silvensis]|uniref:hypothetical protein n=1 Tax=Streptomyces silvensis TaxID=1765722 RepID=UPI0007C707E1|nr:hypothetical protein [Streptomyces silvensis]